ncbi:MAG TPA: hypothetical protein VFF43_00150, partial [Caldimonas sp.]|nr:hypothetical protein [Caldimonas sp.]
MSLLAPGGILVLAAWAVQHEDLVRTAVAPYAVYFCFGTLAASVLLSWYYDQSRLLCTATLLMLSVWRMNHWPDDPSFAKLAAFLLPLN